MTADVVLLFDADPVRVMLRSCDRPATLFVDPGSSFEAGRPGESRRQRCGLVCRRGVALRRTSQILRFILALAARPDAIVSAIEMQDLLWGDDETGGPDDVSGCLNHLWMRARHELVRLGYETERQFGRGFWARPSRRVDNPARVRSWPAYVE